MPAINQGGPQKCHGGLFRRLLSHTGSQGEPEETLDAHPLIRAYFADQLKKTPAWPAAHRRLFEHLTETTEHQPDTLAGLQPLYQAVGHGCEAGRHEQVLFKVYVDRILRGTGPDGFYSSKKLGALGANLGALAGFFDRPWDRPSPNLSGADQGWVLNQAALSLRALGRLREAREPLEAGLERYVEGENWRAAAVSAGNLSELQLTLGAVGEARGAAERSVALADRSEDAFERMVNRATHADALHQAGDPKGAENLFREAEALQAENQPAYPRLYSLPGFRYCDLLLGSAEGAEGAAWRATLSRTTQGAGAIHAPGHTPGHATTHAAPGEADPLEACRQVRQRAEQWFEWRTPRDSLLTIGLDHLTLARTALYQGLLAPSSDRPGDPALETHLAAALKNLRAAGSAHHLPRALLTRAWHLGLTGDLAGAAEDLEEAWEIAQRGPMPLFLADVHLTRARLFGGCADDDYPWDSKAVGYRTIV